MNGPKNNDKKLRRLVEAIEIDALEEMERCTIGKSVFLILTQAACRARRTLEKSLTVVFGFVTTRGPNAPGTAWRSKPSWYIVATNDRTVQPELQRFLAKRMGATTYEVDSSHVPMLSHPSHVLEVIRAAAHAVQGSSTAA